MRHAVALATILAACGDDSTSTPLDASDPIDGAISDGAPPCMHESTTPLMLANGAFAPVNGHPNAIVHVPEGFDPTPPTDVVVYIHGFNNCIENVVGETDTACTSGGPARSAFQLFTQLAVSKKNAILVVPEVLYDQAAGDPGKLGTQDGLKNLLDEALPGTTFGRVIVASHSGGYRAVAAMSTIGGIPVDELWLFDSLYGEIAKFDQYVNLDLASFTTEAHRFANVYSTSGGTLDNSQAMADRAATWVDAAVLVDDRTTATWMDDVYHHGLLFKHSGLSHDGVARYYFERMLSTSGLRAPWCQ